MKIVTFCKLLLKPCNVYVKITPIGCKNIYFFRSESKNMVDITFTIL